MTTWPNIPDDAIHWIRDVFAEANRRVVENLVNQPNVRETSLDDNLVMAISSFSHPHRLPSDTVVEMQVHNIGGLRHYDRWETADIAIIVLVYRRRRLLSQKIGLLQSKRLYPHNNEVEEDDTIDFAYGMNRFLRPEPMSTLGIANRRFEFNVDCAYASLKSGDKQINEINGFNEKFGDAIYYLFYNPSVVPMTVHSPITSHQSVTDLPLGCRVYATGDVHPVLNKLRKGSAPTLAALGAPEPSSNWRLETWAADLLLGCRVGQQIGPDREDLVNGMLVRRSGPIVSAIAISVVLPDG